MLEIIINGEVADISDKTNLNLNKEFETDYETFELVDAEYSFEFDLPNTLRNRRIFGFAQAFDVPSKFDRIYKCQVYANSNLVLDGNVILNEITKESFNINAYVPKVVEIGDILGDLQLKDIKPHYKAINKYSEINDINEWVMNWQITRQEKTSEDDILKYQYDKHICFPYMLYSYPYNVSSTELDRYTQDCSFSGSSFTMQNIFPSFNVLSVIEDIFATKNLKLEGNIFKDKAFTDLYQTFEGDEDDYVNLKDSAYYCSFSMDYNMRKGNNISSTMMVSTPEGFTTELCGYDAPLLSENTEVNVISNEYDMLTRGNGGAYSLTIPKSGWYQFSCNGNWNYISGRYSYSQEGRTNVVGTLSSRGNGTLNHHPFEIQVKKGTPLQNKKLYGLISTIPSIPNDYNDNTFLEIEHHSTKLGDIYLKTETNENQSKFPKNNKTMLINNYSGYDVSDFICGARFGRTNNGAGQRVKFEDGENHNYGDNVKDMRTCACCMPRPWGNVFRDDTRQYLQLYRYNVSSYNGTKIEDCKCYEADSAQAMIYADGFGNFEGYNVFNPTLNLWDLGRNVDRRHFNGQIDNNAYSSGDNGGTWEVHNCVWLEEGDSVSIEIMTAAYNYKSDYHDWDEKNFIGAVNTNCKINFSVGFVSGDKDFIPSSQTPIPSDDEMSRSKLTNVNVLLPDYTAEEYLENFLNTFNLKLRRIDSSTYSIDYASTYTSNGKILKLDDYCNIADAKFSRLEIPSTLSFKFSVDDSEYGFIHGNETAYGNNKVYVPPMYDGSKSYHNPSNTTEETLEKESLWSYTWYEKIRCINTVNIMHGSSRDICVPIVMKNEVWMMDDYESVAKKGYATDHPMRLFYISCNEPILNDNFLQFYCNERFDLCKLIIPKNYCSLQSNPFEMNRISAMFIDFDDYNKDSVENFSNIQTKYFNTISLSTQYLVEMDMVLPSYLYKQIQANTIISFNDGLYRVYKVEGYDTDSGKCTVVLKSL